MRRALDAIRWSLAEWTPVVVTRPARRYWRLELGKNGKACAAKGCPACSSVWSVRALQTRPGRWIYRPMRDGMLLRKGGRVRSFRSLERAQGAILAIGFLECRCLGTCRAAV